MNTKSNWWLVPALTTAATIVSVPAFACGGFFCNTGAPVNQTGEQVLFAVEDGMVEAHVAVQYQGPSEDFAWIVPTPAMPEVGVSSAIVFARLDQMLRAQYYPNFVFDEGCEWFFAAPEADGDSAAGGGDPTDDGGGVTVLEQSSVGPYDYAILQATAVEPLFEWLRANDYDLPTIVEPYVEPYVLMEDDVHFVAFKLSKDRETGDIAPIVLRYASNEPMIPIQLTAVATEPDLGVTAHVLGQHRAVPENYLHVEINEARIDWLNYGSNYGALVTEAMNEAGGQGFATEFAGASSIMANAFWREGAIDLDTLRATADPIAFWQMLQDGLMGLGIRGDSTILGLLQAYIPMPAGLAETGITEQDFYNCLSCYAEWLEGTAFDAGGFANAVDEAIVGPLAHAQELFDRIPYTTRLYTTLSAEEMTKDPYFTFNPDMGDVANVHYADVYVECEPGGDYDDYMAAPVRIVLDDGREVRTTMNGGGREEIDALPAAASIAETGAAGQPVIIDDRNDTIDAQLDELNDQFANLNDEQKAGCTAAPARGSWAAALATVALIGARRRRVSRR